jgi:hypothetical protein
MNQKNPVFINDFVFIEENKHKFSIKKIMKDVSDESYFIFPLTNKNNEIIALFSI